MSANPDVSATLDGQALYSVARQVLAGGVTATHRLNPALGRPFYASRGAGAGGSRVASSFPDLGKRTSKSPDKVAPTLDSNQRYWARRSLSG